MHKILNNLIELKKEQLIYFNEIKEIYTRRKILLEKGNCIFLDKQMDVEYTYVEKIDNINIKIKELKAKCLEQLGTDKIEDLDPSIYPQVKDYKEVLGKLISVNKECFELNKININLGEKVLKTLGEAMRKCNEQANDLRKMAGYAPLNKEAIFFNKKC